MTAAEVIAKLNVDGCTATTSDNGGWHWVRCERHHNGHRYSHTIRLPINPADSDFDILREAFDIWWTDTIKDQG